MSQYLIKRSEKGQPLSAADHDSNMKRLEEFADLPGLLAESSGYNFYQEGEILVTRAEGFRYEVVGPAENGHHLETAGGMKICALPEPDGFYNFDALGGVGDDSTDNHHVLMSAIHTLPVPNIYFPPSKVYYISQTVHVKRAVNLRGDWSGLVASSAHATLRWPTGVRGFWCNVGDTYNGGVVYNYSTVNAFEVSNRTYPDAGTKSTRIAVGAWLHITGDSSAYVIVAGDDPEYDIVNSNGVRAKQIDYTTLGPNPGGSSQGSRFVGLDIFGSSANHLNDGAHGIHSQAKIIIEQCLARHFSGDGVHIFAASDRKVNGPWETYGNASYSQITRLRVTRNGGCGLFLQGYDTSVCLCTFVDAVSNGRWGIWDQSFLGNTHINHHIANNGNAGAGANPSHQSAFVAYEGNRYTAMPSASLADLVATVPGTNPGVWALTQPNQGGHSTIPSWTPGQDEGTYFPGGAFWMVGNSARGLMLGVYTESGQGAAHISGGNMQALGGMHGAGFTAGGRVQGVAGNILVASEFRARSGTTPADYEPEDEDEEWEPTLVGAEARLGGTSGAIFMVQDPPGGGQYRFRVVGNDFRWDHQNSNERVAYSITGQATSAQFGTGENQPHTFHLDKVSIGGRIHRALDAPPLDGAHAQGEIVWNIGPSAGGHAGWICVAAGTPGTWKTFGAIEA